MVLGGLEVQSWSLGRRLVFYTVIYILHNHTTILQNSIPTNPGNLDN